jgi:exosortase C (VPDSG-CTERM-specific)
VPAVVVLSLCFGRPLWDLARFALRDDLYSHLLLIPFISLYLVWLKRNDLPPVSRPDRGIALFLSMAGLAALAGRWLAARSGTEVAAVDSLALTTLSFVLLLGGVCGWFLGGRTLRSIAFPLGFLLLMVPFPAFFRSWLEIRLQYSSAAAASAFFKVVGTPVFHQGLTFQLSTISLEVAPECSGIHSSLALFITSLLAGYFFLRSNWRRSALTLAVIPLAVLRNGFRIFTLGELCVHIGPEMINSPIHHHGGPLFFVLSLVPFLLLLYLLVKSERRVPAKNPHLHEA